MTVRNSEALTYPLEHHAKGIRDMVYFLGFNIATRLHPRGWELHQSGTGPNSWYLMKGDKRFYIRYYCMGNDGVINALRIFDKYHKGKVVTVLTSRINILRFVERLEKI